MTLKRCSKCDEEKDLILGFYTNSKCSGGYNTRCKECVVAYNVEYQRRNADKRNARARSRVKTPEAKKLAAERSAKFLENPVNKAKAELRRKERVKANPEKYAEMNRRSYQRRSQDVAYVLSSRVRSGIRKSLKTGRRANTFDILGYSAEQLIEHMEKQFFAGMSWKNFGEWHIDHIIPLAKLKPATEKEVSAAWCLSNLRPLWAKENMQKKDKIISLL